MEASLFFLNNDARILDLIRKGKEDALVTLYQSNRKAIAAFVMQNNGSQDDAEDMLQEAIVILWERVHTNRFQHDAKLSTFIYATVKNLWFRRLARQKRFAPLTQDLDLFNDDASSILEELIENEKTKSVQDALERIGEPCRKLLMLFYWEELPMDEIARVLGFANAETAKSKKYQCKKALSALLKKAC